MKKNVLIIVFIWFWISLSWIQKGGDFKIGFLLQDPIIWYPNKYYILSKVHRISTISALSENIWRIIFPHWVEKVYSSSHDENYYLPNNNVAIFTRRKNLIGRKKHSHIIWNDMRIKISFQYQATYLYLQDVFEILSQQFFLYLHLKIGILTFAGFFRRFGFC